MRNYLNTRWINVHVVGDDGMGGGADYFVQLCEKDDAKLSDRYQNTINDIKNTQPTWTWTFNFSGPITVYLQLDKTNAVGLFQCGLEDFFGTQIFNASPLPDNFGFLKPKFDTDYTPYRGWTDDAGVKRNPPPSESAEKGNLSGSSNLVTNFFRLCDAIIAELKADKSLTTLFRNRQINLVTQIQTAVSDGFLSITDALQMLLDDGLVT